MKISDSSKKKSEPEKTLINTAEALSQKVKEAILIFSQLSKYRRRRK